MQHTIQAAVWQEAGWYIAEVPQLGIVTQATTLDELVANLREAVGLALEGEAPEELGLAPDAVILAAIEVEPAVAPA